MKTSNLPSIHIDPLSEILLLEEPSATYLVVIAYSYPILVCHQLWDMVEKIDDVQLNVKVEIYETYHA